MAFEVVPNSPEGVPAGYGAHWGRPVAADVNLDIVTANAAAIKGLIGEKCQLLAVVKADGYGLGAGWVAQAALDGGATWLGVACVDEAVELRNAGFTCPILVMGFTSPSEASSIVEYELTPVVHREETPAALERAAARAGKPRRSVNIHIKVDTGLGRYGCLPSEFLPLAEYVRSLPHLHLEGLMTHFADADNPDLTFARRQLASFKGVQSEAQASGIGFDVVHAANSAATLALPEARFDMVRVGLMLSGHYPAEHLSNEIAIRPALTLHTRLTRVYMAESGDTVGYGRTWRAEEPTPVGLIPVGYADGFSRAFSNRAEVLVRGHRCRLAGAVSMDQSSVDLSAAPDAEEGDMVVLAGQQGQEVITVEDLARWGDTISYEILCGLAERVPKRYVRGGRIVSVCNLLGCTVDVFRASSKE